MYSCMYMQRAAQLHAAGPDVPKRDARNECNRDPRFFRRLTIVNFAFLAWATIRGLLILRSSPSCDADAGEDSMFAISPLLRH